MISIKSKFKKLKLKKLPEGYVLSIFSTMTMLALFLGYLFSSWYVQPVHHFDEYRQIISVFIGAILAAMITVIIFYLGKFHDYQREFLKQEGLFNEAYQMKQKSVDEMLSVSVFLESEMELMDNKKYLESKPYFEKLKKTTKDQLSKIEEDKKALEAIDKLHKFYREFPLRILKLSLFDAWPFVYGLAFMGFLDLKPTLGGFYQLIIFLATGVAYFMHSWYLRETEMSEFHHYFKILVKGTVTFTMYKEDINKIIRDMDRTSKYIHFKHSEKQNNRQNENPSPNT